MPRAGWVGRMCCPSAGSTRRGGRARSTPGKRRRCTCCNRLVTGRPMTSGSSILPRCGPTRRSHLRDLLDIKTLGKPVPIEEVESITSIRKRFVTPGMSLGALSPEAHKTLNVAMNRIGAKSDSGRGRRRPGAFQCPSRTATTLRQDQAGRVGAVRRDGGISERLRGAGDQGRAGRQARRGRPASGHEGHGR